MPYLSIEKPSVMGAWLRVSLSSLHVIDIRAIEGCDNGLHSIELLGFAGIYGVDICMGEGASQHMEAPGILRNLIFDKHFFSRYQRCSVYFVTGFTYDVQFRSEGWCNFRLVFTIVP